MMPAAIFLLLLVLAGCAASGNIRQTQPGDTADIHFQCLLQNGEIAAATDDAAVKKDQPKANIYVVRLKNDPDPFSSLARRKNPQAKKKELLRMISRFALPGI